MRLSLGYVEGVELVAVAVDEPPLRECVVDAHVRKRAFVVDSVSIVVRPVIEERACKSELIDTNLTCTILCFVLSKQKPKLFCFAMVF